MGILNKEIRITAVDAGYTNTIDRISENTKRKLAEEGSDTGITELIDEAEQKFESVGDQVRYIAEELNKLKVGKDVFAKERAEINAERLPFSEKRNRLKKVDRDEEDQEKLNQRLADVLEKLTSSVDKQTKEQEKAQKEQQKKQRPSVDQVDHEEKEKKKWYRFGSGEGGRLTSEEESNITLKRRIMGQRAGGIATQVTGNNAVGQSVESVISGYGGLMTIIAAVTGIILANNEFTNKKGRVSGMTSIDDKTLLDHYIFNTGNKNPLSTDIGQLGKSLGEMMEYIVPIAKSRGSRDGILPIGMRQLRMEKGFGLEEGSFSRNDVYSRADNTAQDASKQMMLFIQEARTGKMFGFGSGDFTQLGEKIDQFGRLTALQAQQAEIANQRMSIKLIEAGSEIGGSFADNRAADQWSKLNSAVASPQGNFRQAYIMNRLHNSNPNEDYFHLRKRMEQGIFGEGNLKALLGGVTPNGSGQAAMDDYYLRIQSLTGLSFSASEMLGKKIHKDRTFLNRYSHGDKKAMEEAGFLDDQGRSLQQRGSSNVGDLSSAWTATKSIMENALPSMKESLLKIADNTKQVKPTGQNNKTK